MAQLIAQNVFKAKELEKEKEKASETDTDIQVVAEKQGEMMRDAVSLVKDMLQKQAGRVWQVVLFDYDDYMASLIKRAKKK